MMKEQLVSRCSAGLSAVLLTVPLEKPVQNEEEILDYIKCLFRPEVQKYSMILFTCGDELEDLDRTINECLQNHADLQRLVTECGGKFHGFNNKSKSDNQIQELLQKIEEVMDENRGQFKQMRRSQSMGCGVNFSDEEPDEENPDQTGSAGKSATGNKNNLFKLSAGSNSETKWSSLENSVRMGEEISLIHTLGLMDNLHKTHFRELG
ncbi:uncharacterized protein [Garra rufa]|uniref:uncharacterized protein n=1 Tax=Garra rufa TaxID=137080 RepID=UPI003CCE8E4A